MVAVDRERLVRRGQFLEYFTIGWNLLEGVASVAAGLIAGSLSLVSFGLDSFIEVSSGTALLWRLRRDYDAVRREGAERAALKIVGACFLLLAAYVAVEAATALWYREVPRRSLPGIAIAALSMVAMPLLARAKRRVAAALASDALRADSRQADFCAWLSAILLGGLLLHAAFGWWWADPAAALLMTPLIAKEGMDGLRARPCCGCH
jgi:divalent metal cation (Fe/Co/Zn/Cd) transporter